MELLFSKQGNVYVAEFELTADANLHIERSSSGYLSISQRSVNGKYALVDGMGNYAFDKVIDADLTGIIYPKTIKIESSVEPTYAALTTSGEVTEIKSQSKVVEVTANGTTAVTPDAGFAYLSKVEVKTNVATEGGGSGSGNGNDYQYIDLSKITSQKSALVALSIMAKVDTCDGYMIAPSGALLEFGNMSNAVNAAKAVAISPSMKIGAETVEQVIQMSGIDLSPALISESEFYNLES